MKSTGDVGYELAVELWAAAGPWPSRIAALLGPVAVSVALAATLARPIPPCREGCRSGDLVDRQLAAYDRRVLVVGNSLARRAVDSDLLAEELGLPKKAVLVAALPGSSMGAWYALLAHRVWGRGYRPTDVVFVGIPRSFRVTRPIAGADVAATLELAGSEDPALVRLADRSGPFGAWRDRASLRRRLWRTGAIESVARAARAGQAAFGVPVSADLEEVFGVAGGDVDRIANPFGGAARSGDLGLADRVEDTVVPDIVALASANGAGVWFARVPLRRDDGGADAVADTLPDHGARYLPFADLRVPPNEFRDAWHLGERGADRYTRALATAMRR